VTSLHVLALVAILELVVNRVLVKMAAPGEATWWFTGLDYLGLFFFYFTGTLAALLIGTRVAAAFGQPGRIVDRIATVSLAIAGALAAIPLLVTAPDALSQVLEIAFGVAVIAHVVAATGRDRDLGVQFGLVLVAVPLLLHTASALGAEYLWPDRIFDGPSVDLARDGVVALCIAALATPYCFAPRPFARAVTKPGPVIFAMMVAAFGAVAARVAYPQVAEAAWRAVGIELNKVQADPKLALYLLAVATLAWTLGSCAIAATAPRRAIGTGLLFIVLGGYAFKWPAHFLLPLLGLSLIAEAARTVRDEELDAAPLSSETPPIADATWGSYLGAITAQLRTTIGDVQSLTTRGEGGLMSSVIVGTAKGAPLRVRIERIDGCVLALDVTVGAEIDELRGATLTMWAVPERALGANPPGPPAAPLFKTGDAALDERFKTRGNAQVFATLFDDGLRERAVAALDGWLAFWEKAGLRYRVYPGRGAPLDHPLPLSDLALGRPAGPERLVAVIELLVEVAARGGVAHEAIEPEELA